MFNEDNNGFIFFPYGDRICTTESQKTIIYLVAFDVKKNSLSNLNIISPGDFVSDDIIDRHLVNDVSLNDKSHDEYHNNYFPESNLKSISLITSICIGWSNDSYEYKDGQPWKASFRDLTEEGKRLYYAIKKLHNNKEVRILTFNNI